jgi:hypothetical protein
MASVIRLLEGGATSTATDRGLQFAPHIPELKKPPALQLCQAVGLSGA